MRKIFLVFLVCLMAAANVASAEMLRISEDGVQKFIGSMTGVVYNEDFQKEKPLLLTDAAKIENTEMPEIGASAWACKYGLKTATAPEGEIIFWVDGEEKVSALKVVGYSENSAESALLLLMVAMNAAGLTSADAEFLISNLSDDEVLASSVVWSKERNRCFVLMASGRPQAAEGFQLVLVASDKQN